MKNNKLEYTCFGVYIPEKRETIKTYYTRFKLPMKSIPYKRLFDLSIEAENKLEGLARVCTCKNDGKYYLEFESYKQRMGEDEKQKWWGAIYDVVDNFLLKVCK